MPMIKEIGSKEFPIWLIGDSNPKNWANDLTIPLDPRHPAIHSIWTPIIDNIQDHIFRKERRRIDTSSLYIRNAIENPGLKPKENQVEWGIAVRNKMIELRTIINQHKPVFVFSFGAFSFEFVRRTIDIKPEHPHKYWGSKRLGDAFRKQIAIFDSNQINVFPLLHVSIARGKYIQSHNYFCNQEGANYFHYVGEQLAELFIYYKEKLRVWI